MPFFAFLFRYFYLAGLIRSSRQCLFQIHSRNSHPSLYSSHQYFLLSYPPSSFILSYMHLFFRSTLPSVRFLHFFLPSPLILPPPHVTHSLCTHSSFPLSIFLSLLLSCLPFPAYALPFSYFFLFFHFFCHPFNSSNCFCPSFSFFPPVFLYPLLPVIPFFLYLLFLLFFSFCFFSSS